MEDAARKKRTDCVYFLASRLTCKKGNECEFRHSERVRLNPIDCYYWLKGNCGNLDCGFRHPPLECITESAIDMAQFPAHSGDHTTKSNVPCWYYLSSQCRKGDQCQFLHDAVSVHKVPNAALEHTTIYPPEMRTSFVSPTPSEDFSEMNNLSQSRKVQQLAGGSALEETIPSQESSLPEFKNTTINNSPFLAAECSNNSSRHYSPDQNSEKALKDSTKSDDTSEFPADFYELLDYLDITGHEDDYEMCGNSLYNNARHRSYEQLHCTERALDPASHRKRSLSGRESDVNDEGAVDLRNRSRKQRRMDDHQASHNSCNRVHPIRHETGLVLHGRHAMLRSGIGVNMIGLPHAETENVQTGRHRDADSRNTKRSRRQRHGNTGPGLSSELSRRLGPREAIPSQVEITCFTAQEHKRRHEVGGTSSGSQMPQHQSSHVYEDFEGPKSLSELLEERACGTSSGSQIPQHQSSHVYEDFEGPKSLSELLEEKKRRNANTNNNKA